MMRDHMLGYPQAMAWIDPKPEKKKEVNKKRQPQSKIDISFNKMEDKRLTQEFHDRQHAEKLFELAWQSVDPWQNYLDSCLLKLDTEYTRLLRSL